MTTSFNLGPMAGPLGWRSRWKPLVLSACLALAGVSASAQAPQGQSMEERLRAQLRITTTQLQQAQNELAAFKAGGPAAPPAAAQPSATNAEAETLKKELARARSQLGASQQANARVSEGAEQVRAQAQAATEKAGAQVAQFRNAYDELLKLARVSEAERQRLAGEATTHRTALTQCEAKNTQLYAVGFEILRAYETVDVGSVLASRQPFAAQSRVKFEQIAQQYGDKLYEGRFDARSVNTPAAAPAPAAPATPDTPAAAVPSK